VDDLVQSYRQHGKKRFDPSHRLKASISTATFQKILYVLGPDHEKELRAGRSSVTESGIIFLDWDSSEWGRPTLQAGQHRRAALLKTERLSADITSSPPELVQASFKF